jgi:hypothetical protein
MRFRKCDRRCPELEWRLKEPPRSPEGNMHRAYCKIEKDFIDRMKGCPKKEEKHG